MSQLSEVHKIMFEKIVKNQFRGYIEMNKLRWILRMVFTIPKERINIVIKELSTLGMIKLSCSKYVYINQDMAKKMGLVQIVYEQNKYYIQKEKELKGREAT